jgi:hypothetical protein
MLDVRVVEAVERELLALVDQGMALSLRHLNDERHWRLQLAKAHVLRAIISLHEARIALVADPRGLAAAQEAASGVDT